MSRHRGAGGRVVSERAAQPRRRKLRRPDGPGRDDAVPPFLFMSDSDLATALLRDGHHGWAHRHIRVEVRPAGGQIFIVGYATETFPVVTAIGGMLDCYECGLV